jgi:hypothetical protein
MSSSNTSNEPKPSSALPFEPPNTVAYTHDGRPIVIDRLVDPWGMAPGTWAPVARIWEPR